MDEITQLLEVERIRKLAGLYSHQFDRLDLEGLLALFTEDAVLEFGTREPIVGIAAIRKHYEGSFRKFGQSGPFSTMHAVTNHWIELTGPQSAQGRCYLIDFLITDPKQNPLTFLGLYDDEYRKVGAEWKMHRRRLEFTWPPRNVSAGEPGKRVPWVGDTR